MNISQKLLGVTLGAIVPMILLLIMIWFFECRKETIFLKQEISEFSTFAAPHFINQFPSENLLNDIISRIEIKTPESSYQIGEMINQPRRYELKENNTLITVYYHSPSENKKIFYNMAVFLIVIAIILSVAVYSMKLIYYRKIGRLMQHCSLILNNKKSKTHLSILKKIHDISTMIVPVLEHTESLNFYLQQADILLIALMNIEKDKMIVVNHEGSIHCANQVFLHHTKFHEHEVIGKKIVNVESNFSNELNRFLEAIQEKLTIRCHKIERLVESEKKYFDITLYPLVLTQQKYCLILIKDVTMRVKSAEMIAQTEKMMPLEMVVSKVSHELKNPLTIISQNIQNVLRRVNHVIPANKQIAADEDVSFELIQRYAFQVGLNQNVESILTTVEKISSVMTTVLSFGKRKNVSKIFASLTEILDQILDQIQINHDFIGKYNTDKVVFKRKYDENIPDIYCSLVEIEQAFLNMLSYCLFSLINKIDPQIFVNVIYDSSVIYCTLTTNGNTESETTKNLQDEMSMMMSVAYGIIVDNHQGEIFVNAQKAGISVHIILPTSETVALAMQGLES